MYGILFWEIDGEEVVLIDELVELMVYYFYREDGVSSVGLSSEFYVVLKEIYYCFFKVLNLIGFIILNLCRVYVLLRFNFIRGVVDGILIFVKGEYIGDGKISLFIFKVILWIVGILDLFIGIVEGEVWEVMFNYNVLISIGIIVVFVVLDYMVVFFDFIGEFFFILMVDGKEMKGKISVLDFCGISGKLVEGIKYEINVIICFIEVEIGIVKVEEWIREVVKDFFGDLFVL